jgi:hypothetical protein
MNASTTIPATIQIRRSRLLGLIGGVAALAAAVTWAALAFGVGSGTRIVSGQVDVLEKMGASSRQYVEAVSTMTPAELKATFGTGPVDTIGTLGLSPQVERYVRSIVSMSPAERRATFGTGSVDAIDSLGLSPQAERYVRSIVSMSPAERRATFGSGVASLRNDSVTVDLGTVGSAAIPASGYLDALNSTFGSVAIPASGYLDALNSTFGSAAVPASGYVEAITKMTPAELKATFGTGPVDAIDTLGLSPQAERNVRSIVSMTPAELKATFGTGGVDTIDSLGLSPTSEQYVRAVASMSPAEMKATFGTGH